MTITAARESDAGDILALQKLAFLAEAEIYGDYSIAPLTQTVAELQRDFAGSTILKETTGGAIVGSVRGSLADGTCRVGRLMVHPRFQNKGIGSRLMREIEGLFKDRCERFEIFTGHKSEKNIRLYEKLGYRVFRTERITPVLSLVFMEKLVSK